MHFQKLQIRQVPRLGPEMSLSNIQNAGALTAV
jgi:hypothetical protein